MRQLLLALAAGVVTNGVVVWVVQALRSVIFPLPAGIDPRNLSRVADYYASSASPVGVHMLLLASFAIAGVAGGFVATRMAAQRRVMPALIVGQLALIIVAANLAGTFQPIWVWLASLAIPVPFAWLGARAAGGRSRKV